MRSLAPSRRSAADPFVVIADAIPTMIWMSAPDGACTFVNKAWIEFTGVARSRQLGFGWTDCVHPGDRRATANRYLSAVRSREAFKMEYRLRRADGVYRWIVDHGVPRFDRSGKLAGFIGSCLDISERKTIEEALQGSETRFRLIAENAQDVIYRYRVAPPRGYDYISSAALAITGWTPEAFYADPDLAAKIVHPDDRPLIEMSYQQDPEKVRESVVLRWIHPGGRVVWAEHRRVKILDTDGRVVAIEGVGRDVTERLEIQNRLRESEGQLRQLAARLNSAREIERAHVARELHDELGQTLTGLKFEFTRTIRELMAETSKPELIDRVQSIVGGIELATEMVRGLAASLRPPALDHLGLAAAIELEAAGLARRTGMRCRVSGTVNAPYLTAEQNIAVFRIVQEALTNVVRHADASAVRIAMRQTPRSTSVKIQDNGRGITAAALRDPSSIGLLGMRERAELVGATLSISATPGKGTTVLIAVPATPRRNGLPQNDANPAG
jgi:PAS domain S-box-containing protein